MMTTTVMGLDIATSTGVAWGPVGRMSSWRCLAVECEGSNSEEKADDLAGVLIGLIREAEPAFVVIEMPQRSVKQFGKKPKQDGAEPKMTINPNALQLSGLAGAAVGILRVLDIPWGLIAPATWRSAYFGKGYKPPVIVSIRNGERTETNDWKTPAIEYARLQGISLPGTKKADGDAAEAIGIATSWARCTFIPARHRNAFMALRTGSSLARTA